MDPEEDKKQQGMQDDDAEDIERFSFEELGIKVTDAMKALRLFGENFAESLPFVKEENKVRRYSATKNYFDQRQRQPKNRQARTRRPRKSERRK